MEPLANMNLALHRPNELDVRNLPIKSIIFFVLFMTVSESSL